MVTTRVLVSIPLLCLVAACSAETAARRVNDTAEAAVPPRPFVINAGKPIDADPRESHLRNVRQLTFGGENAEAYWSCDGRRLIMQSRDTHDAADQIFTLDLASGEKKLVSTGTGRTTCSYFLQGDREILFASTHGAGPQVPVAVRVEGKYTWPVFGEYDLWIANADGSNLRRLTDAPGYDAEATVCPVTGRIVFTSVRDGDLELYSMEPDGSDLLRLTNRVGYDGGAFFSHDGSKLVLRSGFPKDEAAAKEYRDLLARAVVAPSAMEITVCDRNGQNFRQVTNNGKANFAPYWCPDDERILFASNMKEQNPRGRNFDLFLIDEDGTGLEQVTFSETFDSFPMFSPDGKWLVFASNRNAAAQGDTNVFVAEWVE